MPYVYILRCADGSLYTGIAKDADARLKAHQAGRGGRYTRARRPVEMAWHREVATWREAMQLERAIKRLPRAKKLALLQSQDDSS
ncbi:MAG: GIY-YIG nuclease family protein [Anaerolineae bacterium]|nr:GIY-YIG nuclease family protein [Candidatus Roseilinea sp.]MDW8450588.1 GIY-YIG nuclease family protein [Anaerolineae bacterium]